MTAQEQFRPGQIWPDTNGVHINAHGGGVLFHEGIYYWFGEHKVEGEAGNVAQVGVHVYSSIDLYNWSDEGIALAVSSDPKSPIARGCILERPKVLFNPRSKQFVMWFHLEPRDIGYAAALSAVAVANKPTGPYQFVKAFRPNAGIWPLNAPEETRHSLTATESAAIDGMKLDGGPRPWYPKQLLFRRDFANGQMSRDMTLFLDDDGLAYHIYASEANGTLHISQLAPDFCQPAGRFIRVLPGRFNEAPAVMKWRGKYFLFTSGCTGWAPNPARLLKADSIFGEWEELGNPCIGTGVEVATTFEAQSTFILPVQGVSEAFIFMADRWRPKNAINGCYVWLPVEFRHNVPTIVWRDEWSLGIFHR